MLLGPPPSRMTCARYTFTPQNTELPFVRLVTRRSSREYTAQRAFIALYSSSSAQLPGQHSLNNSRSHSHWRFTIAKVIMSQSFTAKKRKILDQLGIPDEDYTDLSPKGSIDEGIRELVNDINQLDGFVTTSSCAGRVVTYLEGVSKHLQIDQDQDERSSGYASGGKGGGEWLFVSHDPLDLEEVLEDRSAASMLGLPSGAPTSCPAVSRGTRFVHLKFEPMVSGYSIPCFVCTPIDDLRSCTSSLPPSLMPSESSHQRFQRAFAKVVSLLSLSMELLWSLCEQPVWHSTPWSVIWHHQGQLCQW